MTHRSQEWESYNPMFIAPPVLHISKAASGDDPLSIDIQKQQALNLSLQVKMTSMFHFLVWFFGRLAAFFAFGALSALRLGAGGSLGSSISASGLGVFWKNFLALLQWK